MTSYTFSENLFSDLHKDVCGFRPSMDNEFYRASSDRKQAIWDFYCEALDAQIKAKKAEAATSYKKMCDFQNALLRPS